MGKKKLRYNVDGGTLLVTCPTFMSYLLLILSPRLKFLKHFRIQKFLYTAVRHTALKYKSKAGLDFGSIVLHAHSVGCLCLMSI